MRHTLLGAVFALSVSAALSSDAAQVPPPAANSFTKSLHRSHPTDLRQRLLPLLRRGRRERTDPRQQRPRYEFEGARVLGLFERHALGRAANQMGMRWSRAIREAACCS